MAEAAAPAQPALAAVKMADAWSATSAGGPGHLWPGGRSACDSGSDGATVAHRPRSHGSGLSTWPVFEDVFEGCGLQEVAAPPVEGVDVGTVEALGVLRGQRAEALARQILQELGLAQPKALLPTLPQALPQAFGREEGRELWRHKSGGEVWFWPAADGRRVLYGSADRHLYAVEAETGRELWRRATGNRVLSSVALWKDLALAGSHDRRLWGVEAGSGRVVFQVQR